MTDILKKTLPKETFVTFIDNVLNQDDTYSVIPSLLGEYVLIHIIYETLLDVDLTFL